MWSIFLSVRHSWEQSSQNLEVVHSESSTWLQFAAALLLHYYTFQIHSPFQQPAALKGSQKSGITNWHIITFRQTKWHKEEGGRLLSGSGIFQPTYCQFFYCHNLFYQTPLQNGKLICMSSAWQWISLLGMLISPKHAHVSNRLQSWCCNIVDFLYSTHVPSCLTLNLVKQIKTSECLTELLET